MMATVDPFEAVSAYVRHDFDRYARLAEQTEPQGLANALSASFAVAADRRFAGGSVADVIGFVALVRQRFDDTDDEIDPRAAERLIRAVVLDQADLATGFDDRTVGKVEAMLLGRMADADASDAELDSLFADARALAGELAGGG